MSYQKKKEEDKSFTPHFLILSILLIFFSVWALWEEVGSLRPWKAYQKNYYALSSDRIEGQIQEAKQEFERPQVQQEYMRIKTLLEEEKRKFESENIQKEYQVLKKLIEKADRKITNVQADLLVARSNLMEEEYLYMKYGREKNKKKKEELEGEIQLHEAKKEEMAQEQDKLKKKLKDFTRHLDEFEQRLTSFPSLSRIDELEKLVKSFKKPEIKIHQYFVEDLNRVDRCTSCHVEIENPAQKDYPLPYTTHPAYYIYLENHPPQQFGCTICHQGQGRATTSIEKAHGRVEFWDKPVFEGELTQASCLHCHKNIDELRGAEVLKQGDRILKKSVCFGCHRIDGYENIEKISPPLSRIGEKVSYTWLVKWLLNPSQIMDGATMPDYKFSEEDAQAIADYLFSLTQTTKNDELAKEEIDWKLYDRGKIIYSQSICSICHSANDRGGAYREMYSPDLSLVGSKARREWFKMWFKDPKNYFQNARMSHFRFNEDDIDALTEYLSGEFVDWDLEEEKMSQSFAFEESFIQKGAALIKEYGCFGCHDIEGMEDIEEIGPYLKIDELEEMVAEELTSFADKPMEEFDFGNFTNVAKTRAYYLRKKLEEPRTFRDDLKMPQYNFSDNEIDALMTLVLGFSREEPLAKYRVEKKEIEYQPTGDFAEILEDVKCLSCHKIYQTGSDYAPDLTIEGSKVKEEWLKDYLRKPDMIRPMSEQMPKINLGRGMAMSDLKLSKNEIDIIVDYVKTVLVSDEIPQDLLKNETISPEDRLKGRQIYIEKGCQACHQIGDEGGAIGPPLTTVGSRLIPGYIYKHIIKPKIANRNTREPDLKISEEEALRLTKFLATLKDKK
jgi:mono/diheme cytochrome c family protein